MFRPAPMRAIRNSIMVISIALPLVCGQIQAQDRAEASARMYVAELNRLLSLDSVQQDKAFRFVAAYNKTVAPTRTFIEQQSQKRDGGVTQRTIDSATKLMNVLRRALDDSLRQVFTARQKTAWDSIQRRAK